MLVFSTEDPEKKYRLQVHRFVEGFSEPPTGFLAPEELTHLSEMSSEKRRAEFLQSRFVLKTELAKLTGTPPEQIHFSTVGEGKPVLAESPKTWDFNLSHSGDFFAVAFSDQGQVGVDIEKIRAPHQLPQIAARFFSPTEVLLIQGEQSPQRQIEIFSRFWSGKEALVKCVGGGVFRHVHEVLIDVSTWNIKKLPSEFGSLTQWDLHFFDNVPGYVCSLAFKEGL